MTGVSLADLLEEQIRARLEQGTGPILHPHQQPPDPFEAGWLLLAGRGAGKSWALSHWMRDQVYASPGLRARIIAPTLDDAIASNVEGPSGLLAADPAAVFKPSAPGGARVEWPNGSTVRLIGTPTRRDVDRLRAGGNVEVDAFEEIAANPWAELVVKQAALGRRLGVPRWVAATTPKPAHPVLTEWISNPRVHVSYATSTDNPNLPDGWVDQLGIPVGTDLYRQEIMGEMLSEIAGALWDKTTIDGTRVDDYPTLTRVAVGVDPAKSTGTTGIVVVGLGSDGHLYVLADRSCTGTPDIWARIIAEEATRWDAQVVVESDTGGLWIAQAIKATTGLDLPITSPEARNAGTRGNVRGPKAGRAEPIAALWAADQPTAHIVGILPMLETQLTTWDGTGASPDRMDAMVWAAHTLRQSRPIVATRNPGTGGITSGGTSWRH